MLCKNATYLAMTGDFHQTENLVQHLSIFTPHLVIEFSRSLLAESSEKKRAESLILIIGSCPSTPSANPDNYDKVVVYTEGEKKLDETDFLNLNKV